MSSASPRVIRSYESELFAALALAELAREHIPAILLRDDGGGMYPSLGALSGVRLAVRHEDAVRALHLLDRMEELPPAKAETQPPVRSRGVR